MTTRRKKILIAEDNLVLGQVLKLNLEREGFEVHWEKNGRDALAALKEGQYALFLTDLEMPFYNGDIVCTKARSEFGLTDLPMIMCSAKGLEFDVDEMTERCGLARFLFKPFSMAELLELVNSLVPASSKYQTCS